MYRLPQLPDQPAITGSFSVKMLTFSVSCDNSTALAGE